MSRRPFRITVPDPLNDAALPRFFRGWTWIDNPPEEVVIDFSQCSFVSPWAATLFTAYGIWLQEVRGRRVRVWLDPNSWVGVYLRQIGLPALLECSAEADLRDQPDRFFPMTRFQGSSEVPVLASSMIDLLGLEDEEMAGAVRYSLVELLRNVVQHARSRIGGIATATYFPGSGLVQVVVADIGRGVRAALRERYLELTNDYHAVRFAVQPHVSGTFQRGAYSAMSDNAGLGLFFIKEIVQRSGGGFFFASGNAMADYWGNVDGTGGKKYLAATTPGWRGTFAVIQFRRDMIAEFDSVLETCRRIAAQVRRDPSELALDFAEGIPEIEGLLVIEVKKFEEDIDAARKVRKEEIIPSLEAGEIVVLDFSGIPYATQSFAHACLYEVLRDHPQAVHGLTIVGCSAATQEALRAVAAYAKVEGGE